jgi:glycosyltransferase involved in cell wall biosynthesis
MVKVFYTWGASVLNNKYDPGFGKEIEWDIPLLDGYEFEFVENVSKDPGSSRFNGIDNPGLIAAIKNWNAGAVLIYGWSFKSHLKALRYFRGRIPVFFRGDSTLLDDKQAGIKKIARKMLLRWVYQHIDIAFYTGTNNKAYFEKWGLKKQQLIFAPHAIDNARFAGETHKDMAIAFRKNNNIPAGQLLFLFAGKLEEKKDPFLLGAAFERMQKVNCSLLFAGNGPLEDALKARFGSNPGIHFCGFQNQSMMPVLYNACDVFVLPSRGPGETWGLALNEAMACNKAIIASDRCGGAIDLVQQGENGYVFSSGAEEELSRVMEIFYNNRHLAGQMGERSGHIIRNFSLERVAAQIEETTLLKTKEKNV